MARMSYLDAARHGLAEEMRRDPGVWALGEDLGRGGVFGQYRGLQEEFGPERIADTPISEAAIMGAAVGAAMMGTRPVVEMRFSDFALCAMDELVNQAAKARFMFGGQARVPMVVREPTGMWRSSAAQHSQSLEAWYVHVPGLVVACPATPWDKAAVFASVERTGRLLVAHEAVAVGGFGAEVVATVAERRGSALRVPPRRLGAPRALIGYAPTVEDAMRVPAARVVRTVQEMVG